MLHYFNRALQFAMLLTCIVATSNADVYREWKSTKSDKTITAKVIDKHLDKDVWRCHLLLKDNKKGYWVNIEDLSKPDQDYLSRWINHEERITVVDGDNISPSSYSVDRQLMYIHILKSVEPQIVKITGRMGNDTERFEVPAYDEEFVIDNSNRTTVGMDTQTIESVCTFNKRIIKTIRIELYTMDGSLISKWKYE
jgi:hypothetical protein